MTTQDSMDSSDQPNRAKTKFQIWATVRRAYGFVFANINQLALCLLLLIIVHSLPIMTITDRFPLALASLIAAVWGTITVAPVAVMVHRGVLLDEPVDVKRYFSSFNDPILKKFIQIGLLLYAVPLLLQTFSLWLLGVNVFVGVIVSIGGLAAALYLFRYSLVFPAIATNRYSSFNDAYLWLRGSVLQLFFTVMLAMMPVVIIQILVTSVATSVSGELSPWTQLIGLVFVPIVPAVFSYAYMDRIPTSNTNNESARDRAD